MPCAQELAEKVGQDKPVKDATEAYDKAYGSYQPHAHDHKNAPLTAEPKPMKLGTGK
jgi:hypothetical protein